MIALNLPQIVSMEIAPLLPLATGWIARQNTTSSVKATLLAFLSCVCAFASAFIASVSGGTHFDWSAAIFACFGTWAIAAITHLGLWKHIGVAQFFQSLPGFIGKVG